MPYADMYPGETEAALADRIANPRPKPPPSPSTWSAVADLLAAPLTGAAQGLNEAGRVGAAFAFARPQRDPVPTDEQSPVQRMRAESAARREQAAADADAFFKRGADYWRPDPLTTSGAAQFFHEVGRVAAKVVGYTVAGGTPGAIVGTSLDEGGTSYLSLRDKGVDKVTAAKVGATHAAFTGLSVALPAVAATKLGTAGLVAVTGPGAYMAESATSRAILEAADYPELGAEFDPTDPTGLLLSLVPGAAVGTAVHAVRARSARLAAMDPKAASVIEAAARDPEAVDAAHVVLQRDVLDASMLSRADDPQGRAEHARALDDARRALEEGRPVEVNLQRVDLERARAATDAVSQRLRAAGLPETLPAQVDELPAMGSTFEAAPGTMAAGDPLGDFAPGNPTPRPATDAPPAGPVQRAQRLIERSPEMPVRLDHEAPPVLAREVLGRERDAAAREAAEAQTAIQTAIECALRLGD